MVFASMTSARTRLLGTTLVVVGLLLQRPAIAHEHMYIASTAKGSGTLVLQYDFARVFPVVPLPGTNKFIGTDPAFSALVTDDPADSLYRLRAGTHVRMVVVSMDPPVSIIFNGKTLKNPGDGQSIGHAPYLHQHPEWYLTLPADTTGDYHLSFKVVGPPYKPSAVYTATVSNAGATIPPGGSTTTTIPDPCPPTGTPDVTAVYCRLDEVTTTLDGLTPTTVGDRRILARLYRSIAAVRTAIQTAMGGRAKNAARLMKRADKRLSLFIVKLDAGVRRQHIPAEAGDRIRTIASAAYDALTLLRSSM